MMLKPSKLIATLGSKPQLVTLAADCLIRSGGDDFDEIIVVHTLRDQPETQLALSQLTNGRSNTDPQISLRFLKLSNNEIALHDVTSPEDVDAAFRALYAEVRAIKLQDQAIHLLIAGGRRRLTVFIPVIPWGRLSPTLDILQDIPEAPKAEDNRSYYYYSESKGQTYLIRDMHPSHMFKALKKVISGFGLKLVLAEPAYREMFRRLSEVDADTI